MRIASIRELANLMVRNAIGDNVTMPVVGFERVFAVVWRRLVRRHHGQRPFFDDRVTPKMASLRPGKDPNAQQAEEEYDTERSLGVL